MSELHFSDNYSDLSERTGFQFEFYCESCGDAWRSEFIRYAAGTASSMLDAASSVLGSFFGAGRVANEISDAGYKKLHDKAFAEAIEQAKVHFYRCRKCGNYFCAKCFNQNLHLCTGCAPSIEEEANIAAREAEIEIARENAQKSVKSGGVKTDGSITCPACEARVAPGKFCPECGAKLESKNTCKCGAEISPGAKFCPECGAKQ